MVFLNPGVEACLANNAARPWEPHKYASPEDRNAMLSKLQEWVAGYYERDDAWSHRAHRDIFDAFMGAKVEHRDVGAYATEEQIPADDRIKALGRQRGIR
jgi:hypothetical protein